jgi:hypothetical protein
MILQRRFATMSGHFEPESVAGLAGISNLNGIQIFRDLNRRFFSATSAGSGTMMKI